MKTINLPRNIVNKLLTFSQKNPETEICGLIGAVNELAKNVYPVENIAEDKQRLFEMNPAKQIDAMKKMRKKNETLFAIFHSHPHAPAQPSEADLAQADYPEALYLIISLNTTGVLEMKGFYIKDKQITNTELVYS
jgi:[CysO sulfur-carrier protein]-S-L-cysteine hydrolase